MHGLDVGNCRRGRPASVEVHHESVQPGLAQGQSVGPDCWGLRCARSDSSRLSGVQAAQNVNTPGACHRGIGDTGELTSRIRSILVEFNHRIEQAISTPRLNTYRSEASSDEHAWALYRWNIRLAAAVAPLAADLEVTLRNTIHDRLADHFDRPDWWASTSLLLDDITAAMLIEVVRKHQKEIAAGKVGPARIIADTTLGVWVHLLGRGGHSALGRVIDYESRLWRPALRFGFSRGTFTPAGRERRPTRAEVHGRAALFQRLRNRAAHHEPILNGVRVPGSNAVIGIGEVWERSLELLAWMCPDLADLHQEQSTMPDLLRSRPHA